MEQVSLSPTGMAAVEFIGDLLTGIQGDDSDSHTGGRWHDISIYKTDTGSMATCIAYRTQVPVESDQCHVDMADDVDDIDNILSLYEPGQHIVMDEGNARNRVVDAVVRHYDMQVNDVLEHLKALPADDTPGQPR